MTKLSKRAAKKQLKKRLRAEQEAAHDASEEHLSTSESEMDLDAGQDVKKGDGDVKKGKPQSMDDFLENFGEDMDAEDEDNLGEDLADENSSNEEGDENDEDEDTEFDLEKVKETDPEFYQYMIKNDLSLANFSSTSSFFYSH